MVEKFFGEILTRSERDRAHGRLEISICNAAGDCQTLSLSPGVVAALTSLLDHERALSTDLTKILTTSRSGTVATNHS